VETVSRHASRRARTELPREAARGDDVGSFATALRAAKTESHDEARSATHFGLC